MSATKLLNFLGRFRKRPCSALAACEVPFTRLFSLASGFVLTFFYAAATLRVAPVFLKS